MNNSSSDNSLWTPLPTVHIGGVDIATASRDELADALVRDCSNARRMDGMPPRLIFDVNGHALSLRATNKAYRDDLAAADVVHADGGVFVTVSRLLSSDPIKERSATTDMIHDFAAKAEVAGLSFYLLGGTEEVNRESAAKLTALYPGLVIAGRRDGYFTEAEEHQVLSDIAAARPDVLWVGLGKPKEQEFCIRNRHLLKARWAITCGGCFNYITGGYKRAPVWMQEANLEWLHRMLTNRKLVWRYLTTTPHALAIILLSPIASKLSLNGDRNANRRNS